MTANGQPDGSRAARIILKLYVNGRLLFCVAPPDIDQKKFHPFPPPEENRATKTYTPFENILLKVFFIILFVNKQIYIFNQICIFSQMLHQDRT